MESDFSRCLLVCCDAMGAGREEGMEDEWHGPRVGGMAIQIAGG